ncbi:MAG: hypothetical protein JST54_21975 [Deltaproteobacteria bacterium]|nr:hypothetical protein [Deltaproteobacteria bacterium]
MLTACGMALMVVLAADDPAHEKFRDAENAIDDAVKTSVQDGEYGSAAKAVRQFIQDNKATVPADKKEELGIYAQEATELESWDTLSTRAKTAADLKKLIRALDRPTSRELRLRSALGPRADALVERIVAADPAIKGMFARKVKVTLNAKEWPPEAAQLLVDQAVAELKGLGVDASATAGEDEFAIVSSGCKVLKGEGYLAQNLSGCDFVASARWLHKGNVALGGIDLHATTRSVVGPPAVDDRSSQAIAQKIPESILMAWVGGR